MKRSAPFIRWFCWASRLTFWPLRAAPEAPAFVFIIVELVSSPRRFIRRTNAVEPDGIALESSMVGTPTGLERSGDFVRKVDADALLTTDDFSLTWLENIALSFEPGCRLMMPGRPFWRTILDKAHQIHLAPSSAVSICFRFGGSLPESRSAVPRAAFPVVIRPCLHHIRRSSSSRRWLLHSREELSGVYHRPNGRLRPIVQPFRPGTELRAAWRAVAIRRDARLCGSLRPIANIGALASSIDAGSLCPPDLGTLRATVC